jgi:hypothetical protein
MGLATHWQPAIQEEFREARMNRDHPGIHFVFDLHKRAYLGSSRIRQGAEFIT